MITVDQILDLSPCKDYTRDRLCGLVGDGISEAAAWDVDIPIEDKLWVAVRLLPIEILQRWAVDCAEHVLPKYEAQYPDDIRVRECIETTRAYLRGEATVDELRAAYAASAADAAYAASAADAASAAAAAPAAPAAAYAASAADAAAYAAPAADAAEREWQLARLRELWEEST